VTVLVNFRVEPDERAAFAAAADRCGLTLSAWLREVALAAAGESDLLRDLVRARKRAEKLAAERGEGDAMTKSETMDAIKSAIVDATVTIDGAEVDGYSECYVAMAQDVQGTLPDGVTVEWGPRSAYNKRIVNEAPPEVWERATRGELVL
jgi:antitoxin component of RelBE/YafQ-DinJ toxin-antitoxin module